MSKPRLTKLGEHELDTIRAMDGALNAPTIHYDGNGNAYAEAGELYPFRASQNTSGAKHAG